MLSALSVIVCALVIIAGFYILYLMMKMHYVSREIDDLQSRINATRKKLDNCDKDVIDNDRCIFCGAPIPEGRLTCPTCEAQH